MAIRFNAASDRLLRTTSLPSYNSAYTMMAWVYFVSGTGGSYITILNHNDNSTSNVDELVVADDSVFEFLTTIVSGGSFSGAYGTTIPTTNTWYHVALVRTSTTSLQMYINGVLEATNTQNISGRAANTRMEIGGYTTSDNNPLDGRVAAIKIYNTSLTASEIQNESRYYLPQRTANLHIWTPGVETTATNADNDFSGGGNTWTPGGTLTIEDGPPISWGSCTNTIFLPTGVSVVVSAGVQTANFSTATVSFVLDQILSLGTQTVTFGIPTTSVLLDQILGLNTQVLTLVLNSPSVEFGITADAGVQNLTFSIPPGTLSTDQILTQVAQGLTLTIPIVSLSTDQILALGTQTASVTIPSSTVTVDVTPPIASQVTTLSIPTVSWITEQILNQTAKTVVFSIPTINVLTGGDIQVSLTDAQNLQILLNTPGIVTEAFIILNTNTLVLSIQSPQVYTPIPSTATISRVYLFLGLR